MKKTSGVFTQEVLLHPDSNQGLYCYFDDFSKRYNFLKRMVIHHRLRTFNGMKEVDYRTWLKTTYHLNTATAKALMVDSKTIVKSHLTLAEWLYATYPSKINKVKAKINRVKIQLDKASGKSKKNLGLRLYSLQNRLNRLNQLYQNGPKINLTFGTKKLNTPTTKDAFIAKRDNQLYYLGDKYYTNGNQMVKVVYHSKYNRFDYKIRLEGLHTEIDERYVYGDFIIKHKPFKQHYRAHLSRTKHKCTNAASIIEPRYPITYRVVKRENGCLYLLIQCHYDTPVLTRSNHGVIGVDFNKGFISVSEINQDTYLLNVQRFYYRHKGTSGQTTHSLQMMVNDLCRYALTCGKDIVIEDLKSLNPKKDKTHNKQYNRLLHSFKFSRFKQLLMNKCIKSGILLHEVNPAYTSQIAKEQFCTQRKLNIHDGASFVIAQRYYHYL